MGDQAGGVGIGGLALQLAGVANAERSSRQAAATRMDAAKFEADQALQEAGQSVAVAQRGAFAIDRQTQLLQSRALALAAASGGGASDPTVMNIIGNLGGEGSYRKAQALYEGEAQARALRLKATSDIVSGEIGAQASLAEGRSTMITGSASAFKSASSLYAKYGYKSPPTGGADLSYIERDDAAPSGYR
jgi:hypothetical protein